MSAVEKGDDAWIWANFFRVTSAWLKEYFALEPNKTRLQRIDLPIYVFHGEDDANVSVAGVADLQARFAQEGKPNLQCFVFKGHDHDLNYMLWPVKKTIPEGIRKIFDVAGEIAGKSVTRRKSVTRSQFEWIPNSGMRIVSPISGGNGYFPIWVCGP